MRDVGERAAMHERGRAFERLHEIGLDGVLEQRRHRPFGLEFGRRHEPLVQGAGDRHASEPRFEVVDVVGETEDRHHLGGDGDVEAVFARKAVRRAAEPDDDLSQRPVVHVEDAPPGDPAGVEPKRIAPVDVIVDQRREQIVRRGDRVKVAGEMQIDGVHRHDLGEAAAGRAALHAEARPERRLAQADDRLAADAVERVAEADRRRRLAFAGRRRVDRGHEDELAILARRRRLAKELRLDLGDPPAVRFERVLGDADPARDFRDGLQPCGASDFDVRAHAFPSVRRLRSFHSPASIGKTTAAERLGRSDCGRASAAANAEAAVRLPRIGASPKPARNASLELKTR